MSKFDFRNKLAMVGAVIFLLILPFRFVTNGIANLMLGGIYSTIVPIVAICVVMILFNLRTKLQLNNVIAFIVVLVFVALLISNFNMDTAFSTFKSKQVSVMLPVYLLVPFILGLINTDEVRSDKMNIIFIKVLNVFCVLTVLLCLMRIYEYQKDFGLFNFYDARYYISLIRSPLEIAASGDLGVDSIPTGRTLALMIACVILISNFSMSIKIIVCSIFLYVLIMIMNRQSLGAAVFILFIYASFVLKIAIIIFCILVTLLFHVFIGFDNTRFLDGGGERSELWSVFFNNMDSLKFLGNGVNSFGTIYRYPDVYPHNFSMELLFEVGILAYCIFVFCFLIFFAKTGFRFRSSSVINKYLMISIWYYFIASNVSGDMFYNSVFLSLLASYFILFPQLTRNGRTCVNR